MAAADRIAVEAGGPAALTARFGALAQALSGHPLRIDRAAPGERTCCDGATIFLSDAPDGDPHVEIAVQCLLLAGGSLARGTMLALLGQPKRTRRFLQLEAMRLLDRPATLAALIVGRRILLPPPSTGDTADSLRASGDRRVAEATDLLLGMIRPSRVLATGSPFARGAARPEDARAARPEGDPALDELDDETEADELPNILKRLSSPLNVPNPFSRFFHQALGNRRAAGGGEPGMEVPTTSIRQSRSPSPRGVRADYRIDGDLPDMAGPLTGRWLYPEWDALGGAYRRDWCAVQEVPFDRITDRATRTPFRRDDHLEHGLRRLALGMARIGRQVDGDDLDLDAIVDFTVARRAESVRGTEYEARPAIYSTVQRVRPDLGAMVLLDVSGSVAERERGGDSVLQEQGRAAAALVHGLTRAGNRTAALAFHSQGRDAGRMVVLKRFDDRDADAAVARIAALTPSGYTRLGLGIRHAARRLAEDAGAGRRLLVIVSDGVPYDLDYSGRYGVADVIRALDEVAARSVRVLWLCFGTMTPELAAYLSTSRHHAVTADTYRAVRTMLPRHVATAILRRDDRRAA